MKNTFITIAQIKVAQDCAREGINMAEEPRAGPREWGHSPAQKAGAASGAGDAGREGVRPRGLPAPPVCRVQDGPLWQEDGARGVRKRWADHFVRDTKRVLFYSTGFSVFGLYKLAEIWRAIILRLSILYFANNDI